MARRRVTSRQEIIDASVELFVARGFLRTTVDDIAAHLGISKPTIYSYVDSKGAILDAILEQLVDAQQSAIEAALSHLPSDPPKALETLVDRLTAIAIDRRREFAVYYTEVRELADDDAGKSLREYGRRAVDAVVRILEAGQAQHVLRATVNPLTAAALILNMVGTIYTWAPKTITEDFRRMVRQTMLMLIDGLYCRSPSTSTEHAAARDLLPDR